MAHEPLILISIGQSFYDETASIYDAVRAAWRLDISRARTYGLVLAHRQGMVIGAFRPHETAAVELAAGLWGRAFASAQITPERLAAVVTPAYLAEVARG